MLNQGWVGVTHGVCETRVEGRAASGAPGAGRGARGGVPAVPTRAAAATASVQRAVLAQRVDTGRG